MSFQELPQSFSKYEVQKYLGSGSYADVYLALDTKLERRVVLKILKRRWMEPDFIENFVREAKAAAGLNHRNVIEIYDQGEWDQRVYIDMACIPDGNLAERIKQAGALDPQIVAEFVQQIGSALDYAHARNMIHRDVKPSNIMIRSDDQGREQVVLADFGLVKALQDTESLKGSTNIAGTGPYMAPEQINSPQDLDRRVDVYALGVVAYQMLTGTLPFEGASFVDLARIILKEQPPSLQEHGIHWRIERAVLKALSKEREDRYESAGAFAADFKAAVEIWLQESQERETAQTFAGMATEAMDQGRWHEAVRYWKLYLVESPQSTLAKSQLVIAEREIELQRLRDIVDESWRNAEWETAISALNELSKMLPDDQSVQEQLEEAKHQHELRQWYYRAVEALEKKNFDKAIEYALRIIEQDPDYENIEELLTRASRDKVDSLMRAAMLAVASGDAEKALELITQVRDLDRKGHHYNQGELLQIETSAQNILAQREAERKRKRALVVVGIIFILIVIVVGVGLLLRGCASPISLPVFANNTPTTTPTLEMVATPITPSPSPTVAPTMTPTPTPSPTSTPTPIPTPAFAANAVVIVEGAGLRPGSTTWWRIRTPLPVGTQLDLLGRYPQAPGWVYAQIANTTTSGWVEIDYLQINSNLSIPSLPVITPVPTLTPTLDAETGTEEPTSPPTCSGGPLRLDAWPTARDCISGAWQTTIFVEGHGGNCVYTYYWEGERIAGPMTGSTTFNVASSGYDSSIVGKVAVESAGARVEAPVYVSPPNCGQGD